MFVLAAACPTELRGDFVKQFRNQPSNDFFETLGPTKILPTASARHATTIMCRTDGKCTCHAFDASDSSSLNTSRTPRTYSDTTDLLTVSKNIRLPIKSNSGESKSIPAVCSTPTSSNISTRSLNSSRMNLTMTLPTEPEGCL